MKQTAYFIGGPLHGKVVKIAPNTESSIRTCEWQEGEPKPISYELTAIRFKKRQWLVMLCSTVSREEIGVSLFSAWVKVNDNQDHCWWNGEMRERHEWYNRGPDVVVCRRCGTERKMEDAWTTKKG